MTNEPRRPQPPPGVQTGPNYLLPIDAVWAFVSVDEQGKEGVCAGTFPGLPGITPLIAADEARLQSLVPMARHIARTTGMRIRLIRLGVRSELLVIGPDGQDEPRDAPA